MDLKRERRRGVKLSLNPLKRWPPCAPLQGIIRMTLVLLFEIIES